MGEAASMGVQPVEFPFPPGARETSFADPAGPA
jgi:hypothetical protein